MLRCTMLTEHIVRMVCVFVGVIIKMVLIHLSGCYEIDTAERILSEVRKFFDILKLFPNTVVPWEQGLVEKRQAIGPSGLALRNSGFKS